MLACGITLGKICDHLGLCLTFKYDLLKDMCVLSQEYLLTILLRNLLAPSPL